MSDNQSNVEVKIGSERNFGIVFAIVFAAIGLWPLLGGGDFRPLFIAISFVFVVLAFAAPRVLRVPNKLWFKFGMLLGLIVAPIVMALVFIVTFVPIGLILRLAGKDLLSMKLDRAAPTYWIKRTDDPQSLKYQF